MDVLERSGRMADIFNIYSIGVGDRHDIQAQGDECEIIVLPLCVPNFEKKSSGAMNSRYFGAGVMFCLVICAGKETVAKSGITASKRITEQKQRACSRRDSQATTTGIAKSASRHTTGGKINSRKDKFVLYSAIHSPCIPESIIIQHLQPRASRKAENDVRFRLRAGQNLKIHRQERD